MNDDIKISDEARECGEKEIQAFLKAKEDEDIPVGVYIQLLLNQRDAEIRELRKDKERLDWLEAHAALTVQTDQQMCFWNVRNGWEIIATNSHLRCALDAAMSNETKGEQK